MHNQYLRTFFLDKSVYFKNRVYAPATMPNCNQDNGEFVNRIFFLNRYKHAHGKVKVSQ